MVVVVVVVVQLVFVVVVVIVVVVVVVVVVWATSSWLPASGWAVQEIQGLSEEHNDSVWHHTL